MFKSPQNNEKYFWTAHVVEKMRFYGISESRVKRVIRFPERTEEGIVEDTIAVMQPNSMITGKDGRKTWKQEIWVMYVLVKSFIKKEKKEKNLENFMLSDKRIKIITAWRYPGVSSKRDPIPEDVLGEIRNLL